MALPFNFLAFTTFSIKWSSIISTFVAIVDGCATVKNIKKSKDMVILYPQSSNPVHKPIYLNSKSNSMINGKVIMVLDNPNI